MNPFAQDLLWVFRVADCGGPRAAVLAAKLFEAGLIVKYHDGDPADDAKYGFQEQFRAVLREAQAWGVPVLAWGYCYGNKYGNLLKEADAAAQSLKEGALGYVIDAEIEWEVPQGGDWAKRFVERVLSQVPGAQIAFAPFWNMRYHPRYPAKAFAEAGCVAVMPQVYYALAKKRPDQVAAMWQVTLEDFSPIGLPVYPIGEFPGATPEHVRAFLAAIGDRPRSWWLLDKASPVMLEEAYPERETVPFDKFQQVVDQLELLEEKLARIREIVGG